MKKIVFPLYSVISAAAAALLLVLGFLADQVVKGGINLYTGLSFFTIEHIRILFLLLSVTLLPSAILVFMFQNIRNKPLNVLATVFLALIALVVFAYLVLCVSAYSPMGYAELVSEDGAHHIVIAEDNYFFSPYGGEIYEKTSPFTMKKLQRYTAEIDFYTPFSDGKYTVTWHEENFELFYDSNGDGEIDESILIDYLDE